MNVKKILTRIYVDNIGEAVTFYENLMGKKADRRSEYEAQGIELAEIGNLLLVCGDERSLRFMRRTFASVYVDSLEEAKGTLEKMGAQIVRDVQPLPTGKNMIVRHPDGTTVEYVEV